MAIVYLGLGANLGNKQKQLRNAIKHLSEKAGKISAFSDFYETMPWGYQSSFPYLNTTVQLETALSPVELLTVTQQIERKMGRTAKSKDRNYADRTIDIDMLIYDKAILKTPDLILPHPLMHQRLFVLQPLAEIAPYLLHPVFKKTITALCNELKYNTPSY